jgi:pilus assembly protein CpaB
MVMLALILATLATAGVFLYSKGVKENAIEGGDLRSVVVSKVDIPANTDLSDLISQGRFATIDVPKDAVIDGAVTQVTQLEGQRNSVVIFANEQIPLARIRGNQVPGGLLSIPEGEQAITVSLDASRAVSGALTGGDDVTLYATFDDVQLGTFDQKSLKSLIKGKDAGVDASNAQAVPRFDTTVVLAPQVQVLRVVRPTTQTIAGSTEVNQDPTAALQVILALEPADAQRLVFALEEGKVYLSLLPPDETGTDLDPVSIGQVLLPEASK